MARYSKEYKERVSAEVGVSAATLERWRAQALESASGGGEPARRVWTAAARLQAVIATASLDETAKSAWCQEQGVYPQELTQWVRIHAPLLDTPTQPVNPLKPA